MAVDDIKELKGYNKPSVYKGQKADRLIKELGIGTVEDFNNLGVAVWIQDDVTKEILQSTTASLVLDVNEDLTRLNKFMVFPNPSNDIATITFMGIQGNDIDVKLVNLLGEVVLHESFTSSSTLDDFNIDVSSFSNGVYNVVITSNDKISTQQLQILR